MSSQNNLQPVLTIILLLSVSCSSLPYGPYNFFPDSPFNIFPSFNPFQSFNPYGNYDSAPPPPPPPPAPVSIPLNPYRVNRDVLDNAVDSANGLISHLSHLQGQLFGLPDNRTGDKVAEWHPGMDVNPEELGEYADGDILYPAAMGRNGVKAESARWPNGVVPYMLSPFFNEQQQRLIREAMNDYHKHTCIKFKPYEGEETDYIRITAGNTGCWSSVGRVGGRQDVNLQVPGCVTKKGTIIHELMHAVGFLHEQSRYERDDFVNIQWHNIQTGREGNFEKSQRSTTNAFGVGYDYSSVMHYSANAFSRNGQPTIVPRARDNIFGLIGNIFQGQTTEKIGQREGFSVKDIQKIRRMYKCSKRRRSSGFFFF